MITKKLKIQVSHALINFHRESSTSGMTKIIHADTILELFKSISIQLEGGGEIKIEHLAKNEEADLGEYYLDGLVNITLEVK